ncbi:hypothetical protein ISCGN_020879 [Ixodes scapularis]
MTLSKFMPDASHLHALKPTTVIAALGSISASAFTSPVRHLQRELPQHFIFSGHCDRRASTSPNLCWLFLQALSCFYGCSNGECNITSHLASTPTMTLSKSVPDASHLHALKPTTVIAALGSISASAVTSPVRHLQRELPQHFIFSGHCDRRASTSPNLCWLFLQALSCFYGCSNGECNITSHLASTPTMTLSKSVPDASHLHALEPTTVIAALGSISASAVTSPALSCFYGCSNGECNITRHLASTPTMTLSKSVPDASHFHALEPTTVIAALGSISASAVTSPALSCFYGCSNGECNITRHLASTPTMTLSKSVPDASHFHVLEPTTALSCFYGCSNGECNITRHLASTPTMTLSKSVPDASHLHALEPTTVIAALGSISASVVTSPVRHLQRELPQHFIFSGHCDRRASTSPNLCWLFLQALSCFYGCSNGECNITSHLASTPTMTLSKSVPDASHLHALKPTTVIAALGSISASAVTSPVRHLQRELPQHFIFSGHGDCRASTSPNLCWLFLQALSCFYGCSNRECNITSHLASTPTMTLSKSVPDASHLHALKPTTVVAALGSISASAVTSPVRHLQRELPQHFIFSGHGDCRASTSPNLCWIFLQALSCFYGCSIGECNITSHLASTPTMTLSKSVPDASHLHALKPTTVIAALGSISASAVTSPVRHLQRELPQHFIFSGLCGRRASTSPNLCWLFLQALSCFYGCSNGECNITSHLASTPRMTLSKSVPDASHLHALKPTMVIAALGSISASAVTSPVRHLQRELPQHFTFSGHCDPRASTSPNLCWLFLQALSCFYGCSNGECNITSHLASTPRMTLSKSVPDASHLHALKPTTVIAALGSISASAVTSPVRHLQREVPQHFIFSGHGDCRASTSPNLCWLFLQALSCFYGCSNGECNITSHLASTPTMTLSESVPDAGHLHALKPTTVIAALGSISTSAVTSPVRHLQRELPQHFIFSGHGDCRASTSPNLCWLFLQALSCFYGCSNRECNITSHLASTPTMTLSKSVPDASHLHALKPTTVIAALGSISASAVTSPVRHLQRELPQHFIFSGLCGRRASTSPNLCWLFLQALSCFYGCSNGECNITSHLASTPRMTLSKSVPDASHLHALKPTMVIAALGSISASAVTSPVRHLQRELPQHFTFSGHCDRRASTSPNLCWPFLQALSCFYGCSNGECNITSHLASTPTMTLSKSVPDSSHLHALKPTMVIAALGSISASAVTSPVRRLQRELPQHFTFSGHCDPRASTSPNLCWLFLQALSCFYGCSNGECNITSHLASTPRMTLSKSVPDASHLHALKPTTVIAALGSISASAVTSPVRHLQREVPQHFIFSGHGDCRASTSPNLCWLFLQALSCFYGYSNGECNITSHLASTPTMTLSESVPDASHLHALKPTTVIAALGSISTSAVTSPVRHLQRELPQHFIFSGHGDCRASASPNLCWLFLQALSCFYGCSNRECNITSHLASTPTMTLSKSVPDASHLHALKPTTVIAALGSISASAVTSPVRHLQRELPQHFIFSGHCDRRASTPPNLCWLFLQALSCFYGCSNGECNITSHLASTPTMTLSKSVPDASHLHALKPTTVIAALGSISASLVTSPVRHLQRELPQHFIFSGHGDCRASTSPNLCWLFLQALSCFYGCSNRECNITSHLASTPTMTLSKSVPDASHLHALKPTTVIAALGSISASAVTSPVRHLQRELPQHFIFSGLCGRRASTSPNLCWLFLQALSCFYGCSNGECNITSHLASTPRMTLSKSVPDASHLHALMPTMVIAALGSISASAVTSPVRHLQRELPQHFIFSGHGDCRASTSPNLCWLFLQALSCFYGCSNGECNITSHLASTPRMTLSKSVPDASHLHALKPTTVIAALGSISASAVTSPVRHLQRELPQHFIFSGHGDCRASMSPNLCWLFLQALSCFYGCSNGECNITSHLASTPTMTLSKSVPDASHLHALKPTTVIAALGSISTSAVTSPVRHLQRELPQHFIFSGHGDCRASTSPNLCWLFLQALSCFYGCSNGECNITSHLASTPTMTLSKSVPDASHLHALKPTTVIAALGSISASAVTSPVRHLQRELPQHFIFSGHGDCRASMSPNLCWLFLQALSCFYGCSNGECNITSHLASTPTMTLSKSVPDASHLHALKPTTVIAALGSISASAVTSPVRHLQRELPQHFIFSGHGDCRASMSPNLCWLFLQALSCFYGCSNGECNITSHLASTPTMTLSKSVPDASHLHALKPTTVIAALGSISASAVTSPVRHLQRELPQHFIFSGHGDCRASMSPNLCWLFLQALSCFYGCSNGECNITSHLASTPTMTLSKSVPDASHLHALKPTTVIAALGSISASAVTSPVRHLQRELPQHFIFSGHGDCRASMSPNLCWLFLQALSCFYGCSNGECNITSHLASTPTMTLSKSVPDASHLHALKPTTVIAALGSISASAVTSPVRHLQRELPQHFIFSGHGDCRASMSPNLCWLFLQALSCFYGCSNGECNITSHLASTPTMTLSKSVPDASHLHALKPTTVIAALGSISASAVTSPVRHLQRELPQHFIFSGHGDCRASMSPNLCWLFLQALSCFYGCSNGECNITSHLASTPTMTLSKSVPDASHLHALKPTTVIAALGSISASAVTSPVRHLQRELPQHFIFSGHGDCRASMSPNLCWLFLQALSCFYGCSNGECNITSHLASTPTMTLSKSVPDASHLHALKPTTVIAALGSISASAVTSPVRHLQRELPQHFIFSGHGDCRASMSPNLCWLFLQALSCFYGCSNGECNITSHLASTPTMTLSKSVPDASHLHALKPTTVIAALGSISASAVTSPVRHLQRELPQHFIFSGHGDCRASMSPNLCWLFLQALSCFYGCSNGECNITSHLASTPTMTLSKSVPDASHLHALKPTTVIAALGSISASAVTSPVRHLQRELPQHFIFSGHGDCRASMSPNLCWLFLQALSCFYGCSNGECNITSHLASTPTMTLSKSVPDASHLHALKPTTVIAALGSISASAVTSPVRHLQRELPQHFIFSGHGDCRASMSPNLCWLFLQALSCFYGCSNGECNITSHLASTPTMTLSKSVPDASHLHALKPTTVIAALGSISASAVTSPVRHLQRELPQHFIFSGHGDCRASMSPNLCWLFLQALSCFYGCSNGECNITSHLASTPTMTLSKSVPDASHLHALKPTTVIAALGSISASAVTSPVRHLQRELPQHFIFSGHGDCRASMSPNLCWLFLQALSCFYGCSNGECNITSHLASTPTMTLSKSVPDASHLHALKPTTVIAALGSISASAVTSPVRHLQRELPQHFIFSGHGDCRASMSPNLCWLFLQALSCFYGCSNGECNITSHLASTPTMTLSKSVPDASHLHALKPTTVIAALGSISASAVTSPRRTADKGGTTDLPADHTLTDLARSLLCQEMLCPGSSLAGPSTSGHSGRTRGAARRPGCYRHRPAVRYKIRPGFSPTYRDSSPQLSVRYHR